jgi:hypothetical protein
VPPVAVSEQGKVAGSACSLSGNIAGLSGRVQGCARALAEVLETLEL